tara:strand:- start:159 stop:326 length:168 start_codon:yes stop_codon:yes gene_type:complete
MSPSKEERNDLYPLNKRTNIAIGYKKEEKILNENAFDEMREDKKINIIDKNEISI